MTKLALIGSSHAGAMYYGWQDIADKHPDVQVHFIVGREKILRKWALDESLVFKPVEGEDAPTNQELKAIEARCGDTVFDLKEADVVVRLGMNPDPGFLRHLFATADIDGERETAGQKSLLSGPAFDAILEEYCQRILPTPEWHNWQTPRLVMVDNPRRNEDLLSQGRTPESPAFWGKAHDMIEARLAELTEGAGIIFVPQPRETIAENGLTKSEFGEGSARFNTGRSHSEADTAHMNGAYGAIIWSEIFKAIA